jgi:hypothetical protein
MNETAVIPLPPQQAGISLGFDDAAGFAHMQRVAKVFSASVLVPETFRGEQNIANCVIALDMAKRLGANPLAVMQHLYIVHGKPGWSSQWIIGAINTCGRFEPLRFDVTGKADAKECVAWTVTKGVRLPDGVRTLAQAREYDVAIFESPAVSIAMAKAEGWYGKSGSKWKTMEDLMLRYRAATFFGRLYAPELLMGMKSVEEIVDIESEVVGERNVTPGKQTLGDVPPRLAKLTPPPPPPGAAQKREPQPEIAAADEAIESAAGLAPEQPPTEQPTEPANVGVELGKFMLAQGIDWETFRKYAIAQGWRAPWADADGFEALGMLATEAAEGFWTVRERIVKQIAKAKAEGKV